MSETVIELKDVDIVFDAKDNPVHAVDHVSLTVERGDIFGIVGYSGAGKSTLVRTINLLQRPTSGSVDVLGQEMQTLSARQLRAARRRIGMIFQHFNLLSSLTVAQNVAFPLKGQKSRAESAKKVAELLELVGLSDRADAYPSELSGGQKQRVAIARALANDPEILISDEATSALDPKTTASILDLLKKLNQQLNLTIVLITHEMEAVKQICNYVAVMEEGKLIEQGSLKDVFVAPKAAVTRAFIESALQSDQILSAVRAQPTVANMGPDEVLARLTYTGASTAEPLITTLFEDYGVVANILYGDSQLLQDTLFGHLIVIFRPTHGSLDEAFHYLAEQDVHVERLDKEEVNAE